jgi:hypothetical protein
MKRIFLTVPGPEPGDEVSLGWELLFWKVLSACSYDFQPIRYPLPR